MAPTTRRTIKMNKLKVALASHIDELMFQVDRSKFRAKFHKDEEGIYVELSLRACTFFTAAATLNNERSRTTAISKALSSLIDTIDSGYVYYDGWIDYVFGNGDSKIRRLVGELLYGTRGAKLKEIRTNALLVRLFGKRGFAIPVFPGRRK